MATLAMEEQDFCTTFRTFFVEGRMDCVGLHIVVHHTVFHIFLFGDHAQHGDGAQKENFQVRTNDTSFWDTSEHPCQG